jgi:hypothetical protein
VSDVKLLAGSYYNTTNTQYLWNIKSKVLLIRR